MLPRAAAFPAFCRTDSALPCALTCAIAALRTAAAGAMAAADASAAAAPLSPTPGITIGFGGAMISNIKFSSVSAW